MTSRGPPRGGSQRGRPQGGLDRGQPSTNQRGGGRGGPPQGGLQRGGGRGRPAQGGPSRGVGRGRPAQDVGGGHGQQVNPAEIYNPEPAEPYSAIGKKHEDQVVASNRQLSLHNLSLSTSRLPARPGFGTQGREILLRTNYFWMTQNPRGKLFKYNMKILVETKVKQKGEKELKVTWPEETNKRKRRRAVKLLLENDYIRNSDTNVASDFNNTLITTEPLDFEGSATKEIGFQYHDLEETVPRENAPNYRIAIDLTGTVLFSELRDYLGSMATDQASTYNKADAIQALNIVMARAPNLAPNNVSTRDGQKDGSKPAPGNNFYPYPVDQSMYQYLGGALIAVRGYYASVRTTISRTLVNINAKTSPFYPEWNMVKLMHEYRNGGGEALDTFVSMLKIKTKYLKDKGKPVIKVKTILRLSIKSREGVDQGNADQIKFADDNGRTLSVRQYFKEKYQITLSHPELPVLNCGTKEVKATKDRPAKPERRIWIPAELCDVMPGQMHRRFLSNTQTTQMLGFAAVPPAVNAKRIMDEGLAVMGVHDSQNPNRTEVFTRDLHNFGLKIVPKMATVPGRVLVAPQLVYGNGMKLTATAASWNMSRSSFVTPVPITMWTIMKIGNAQWDQQAYNTFTTALKRYGLGTKQPLHPRGKQTNINDRDGRVTQESIDANISEFFTNALNEKVKIVLVLLPSFDAPLYYRVKFLGDVRFGVQTVCVQGKKITKEKGQEMYCANVLLKFNLKSGGINHSIPTSTIPFLKDPGVMLVGIDVTHPSPDSAAGAPSIAGVVASVDSNYAQYPASMRVQESRKEMVTHLQTMIEERLNHFRFKNKAYPKKVLVYRDGVSEGQYKTVLEQELPAFHNAFKKLYPANQRPKISIIIVGKRHHTRFYPTRMKDSDEKTGNPQNGTVVDRGVTMEQGWDFFLQAHTALLGTARPAHYVVVHDELKLGANELEQITHSLCYLFGRATKAVSICPPAYFADLLCERGRGYLASIMNSDNISRSSGLSTAVDDFSRLPWTRDVHERLKDSMFYI